MHKDEASPRGKLSPKVADEGKALEIVQDFLVVHL